MYRSSLLLVALLISNAASAQRPWLPATNPLVGASPHITTAASALYAYDVRTAVSYDHGTTWTPLPTLDNCKAITDYANNTTIALCQASEGGIVNTFFTISGNTWTPSDVLDLNGKHVVDAVTLADTLYIATTEGWVYAWANVVDSFTIGVGGSGLLRQFGATSAALFAVTSNGMMVSTNHGDSWTLNNPPSALDGLDVTTCLEVFDQSAFASTDQGVFEFDPTKATWEPKGVWPMEISSPNVAAVAADNGRIIAMCRTPMNRGLCYRLESADTAWVVTGYELPMDAPSIKHHALDIDFGWAIAYLTSEAEPDSNGLYVYNLNDLTDVNEDGALADLEVRTTEHGLLFFGNVAGTLRVDVMRLDGRCISSATITSTSPSITLPSDARGVLCIVASTDLGSVFRHITWR